MSTRLHEIARRLAGPARDAWTLPRFLIPTPDSRDEQWYDRSRAERAGNLIAVGKEGAGSLSSTLGNEPQFISAPSGRGKSHVAALLAREAVDRGGQPVVILNVQDVERAVAESLVRVHFELDGLDEPACARLLKEQRCVLVIDDWERARPEQRRAIERDVKPLIQGGSSVMFLGTPEAQLPRVDGLVALRLLAFTPLERSEYLRRRLPPTAVADADRVARVLEAISGEAFFLAKIADYYATRMSERRQDPRSIIAIMRRLLDAQLSSRCTAEQTAQLVAALQDLALSFDRFSLQDAKHSLSTTGAPELAGTLVAVGVQAGLLRQPHLNCFEFAHGLWRAFLLVASTRDDDVPDPVDVERWMTSPNVRLRDAVGALVPWAEMPEPARTKLLRRAALHDFQAYRNAVRALDAVDAPDQALPSYVSGIEDVGSLLSDRAKAMVEPWSLYEESEVGRRPGAMRMRPWIVFRLRAGDEPVVVDAATPDEEEAFAPPIGRRRSMTMSRWLGCEFVVKQLHTLLKRGWLPHAVLARERLAYIEAAIGRDIGTVARLRSLTKRHAEDLFLGKGALLENGAHRARYERGIDGYQGFTGAEISGWLDLAALAPGVKLRDLRHPGPDRTEHRMFRDQYSPAQRLLRRSINRRHVSR